MGCSVVYYPPATTAAGGGLLSRNYDFPTTSAAQIMAFPPRRMSWSGCRRPCPSRT